MKRDEYDYDERVISSKEPCNRPPESWNTRLSIIFFQVDYKIFFFLRCSQFDTPS